MQREGRRREEILVDTNWRHSDAVDGQLTWTGNLNAWFAHATRRECIARFVEQCDLTELADLKDEILQNPGLLRLGETSVL